MSLPAKFKALVHDLDKAALEELGRLVASELSRSKGPFEINQIHPRMSQAEKERAAREIADVLRGQE